MNKTLAYFLAGLILASFLPVAIVAAAVGAVFAGFHALWAPTSAAWRAFNSKEKPHG